jgi:ankyrin repeat protein
VANHADVVKALLAGGAKVNAADDEKTTALHYAAYANFPDTAVAEVLLAAGADRALKDATNRTPLEVAKAFGRAKLVALLGAAPRP